MAKIHTAQKRRKGIRSTTRKHRFWFSNVEAKKGAKSFASREKAQEWAKENGVDTKEMVLHETRAGKIQWRPKPRA